MTTLREAAKLALTAMEESEEYGQYLPVCAIDTLREALAAQDKQDETRDNLERYTQEVRNIMARKPLTDEEILKAWKPFEGNPFTTKYEFARAIERAHGIGEKE